MHDIFFVSYKSAWSDANQKALREIIPYVRKIDGNNKTLEQVFDEASTKSLTKKFWVIDGSVRLFPSFKDFDVAQWDEGYIHAFKVLSRNGVHSDGIYFLSKEFTKPIAYKFMDKMRGYRSSRYDIFFISYKEKYADRNFEILQSRFPDAKRIDGIKGIHEAHMAAAQQSQTEMFWVVDADAVILNKFNFSYRVSPWDLDQVHVWRSKNPINDLTYGYGGVKLLPRELTLQQDATSVDMTTSISTKFKIMNTCANITQFNTDPFNTWKSAFRECVKLAGNAIDGSITDENVERLNTWCTKGADKEFGEWCIAGAVAGRKYGQENAGNKPALAKINDFNWLLDQFNSQQA